MSFWLNFGVDFSKMLKIGLIREGKVPNDNRVAFTPQQCRWIEKQFSGVRFMVQPSPFRCFADDEFLHAGIMLHEDLSNCDLLFGIKEVPVANLIPGKTYLIFSHTRKRQTHNQELMHAIITKKISLIDYECLVHEDGQRILGFGFFAGVVGGHNGLRAYGQKTGLFQLPPVYKSKNFRELINAYFGLKLPPIRIVLTGSGRVAAGCIDVMNLVGIKDIEPEEFSGHSFSYPVFTQLKGATLFSRFSDGGYSREQYHRHPELYQCRFPEYLADTDILVNGIYWEPGMPRLFNLEDLRRPDFRPKVIADITCDKAGSVPCNLGATSIEDPVYGVDKYTGGRTLPFLPDTLDIMSVDNLPNELPRDASQYFGEQLIKYVLEELLKPRSTMLEQATIVKNGVLTPAFEYLRDFAFRGPDTLQISR